MCNIANGIISRKNEIITLCDKIISGSIDVVEAIRKINSLNFKVSNTKKCPDILENIIPNEELSNFCTLFDDETELIPKGTHRNYCSERFLDQMDKEEQHLLEFYRNDIIEFAWKTLDLLRGN